MAEYFTGFDRESVFASHVCEPLLHSVSVSENAADKDCPVFTPSHWQRVIDRVLPKRFVDVHP